jgi:lysozyme
MNSLGLIHVSDGSVSALNAVESAILSQFSTTSSKAINHNGLALIKHFESVHDGDKVKERLQPQMDPSGIWTVGYGHALRHPNGVFMEGIKDKAKAFAHPLGNLDLFQAITLLEEDCQNIYMPLVYRMVNAEKLNGNQKAALCAFVYNCGTHYRNKAGKLIPFAIWQNINKMNNTDLFNYWASSVTMSKGKVLPGLIRRRKAEAHLFIHGQLKFYF